MSAATASSLPAIRGLTSTSETKDKFSLTYRVIACMAAMIFFLFAGADPR